MRVAVLPLLMVLVPACAHGSDLREAIARSAALSDGRIAVTVQDLSTRARASINGDVKMPMMSVFKLALAVVALDTVDHGQLRLDQAIPIAESELEPDQPIAVAWKNGDHAPPLETVLQRMIQDSDNTAADKMVMLLGGAATVTARLRALGVAGIDVIEPEVEIGARLSCPGVSAPAGGWTHAAVAECSEPPEAQAAAAAMRELETSRNDATSDALVDLLARLDGGVMLSAPSRRWLLTTLSGTTTGPRRIKGMLPVGAVVGHKTGTARAGGVSIATNDVGIVTAPDGRRFAIAVLVAGSRAELSVQEDLIACIARDAWNALIR